MGRCCVGGGVGGWGGGGVGFWVGGWVDCFFFLLWVLEEGGGVPYVLLLLFFLLVVMCGGGRGPGDVHAEGGRASALAEGGWGGGPNHLLLLLPLAFRVVHALHLPPFLAVSMGRNPLPLAWWWGKENDAAGPVSVVWVWWVGGWDEGVWKEASSSLPFSASECVTFFFALSLLTTHRTHSRQEGHEYVERSRRSGSSSAA